MVSSNLIYRRQIGRYFQIILAICLTRRTYKYVIWTDVFVFECYAVGWIRFAHHLKRSLYFTYRTIKGRELLFIYFLDLLSNLEIAFSHFFLIFNLKKNTHLRYFIPFFKFLIMNKDTHCTWFLMHSTFFILIMSIVHSNTRETRKFDKKWNT